MNSAREILNDCLEKAISSLDEKNNELKNAESRVADCRKDVEGLKEKVDELRTAIRALGGEPKK
jgi:peptidoglycan hydrolase CwlO-like protein